VTRRERKTANASIFSLSSLMAHHHHLFFFFLTLYNPAPHYVRDSPPFDVHLRHYISRINPCENTTFNMGVLICRVTRRREINTLSPGGTPNYSFFLFILFLKLVSILS
jgi:hypothetical protein